MANTTVAAGSSPAPMNVFTRFIGVIFSPRQTFENVAAHPRVLGMLVLVCVISAIVVGAFFASPTGQEAFLDMMAQRSGGEMSEEQLAAMQKIAPYAAIFVVLQSVIGGPLMMVIIAGILFAIFNAAMGGNASFKQVFAVVVHSWVILTVSQFFTIPLSFARGTLTSATNLGVLLPMVDEESFLGAFLGSIDFFLVWAVVVLAIGLAVLFRRKTQPIAISLLSLYGVIALIIAFVKSS